MAKKKVCNSSLGRRRGWTWCGWTYTVLHLASSWMLYSVHSIIPRNLLNHTNILELFFLSTLDFQSCTFHNTFAFFSYQQRQFFTLAGTLFTRIGCSNDLLIRHLSVARAIRTNATLDRLARDQNIKWSRCENYFARWMLTVCGFWWVCSVEWWSWNGKSRWILEVNLIWFLWVFMQLLSFDRFDGIGCWMHTVKSVNYVNDFHDNFRVVRPL